MGARAPASVNRGSRQVVVAGPDRRPDPVPQRCRGRSAGCRHSPDDDRPRGRRRSGRGASRVARGGRPADRGARRLRRAGSQIRDETARPLGRLERVLLAVILLAPVLFNAVMLLSELTRAGAERERRRAPLAVRAARERRARRRARTSSTTGCRRSSSGSPSSSTTSTCRTSPSCCSSACRSGRSTCSRRST